MKKRNRVVAIMLATAMTMSMGMGTVSFAANYGSATDSKVATVTGNLAAETDRGSIKVEGVTSGTITAYQVARGIYEGGYFKGYESLVTGVDAEHIDAAAVTADIIANPNKYTTTFTGTELDSLPVGVYVIIVSGTKDARVYSPMMGSVYYSPADQGESIMGTTIQAKYTDGGVTGKEITGVDGNQTVIVNGVATDQITVGSTISFKVTGTVPSYDLDMYKDIAYTLTDTLSTGLSYVENSAVVKVDDTVNDTVKPSFASNTLTFALDETNIASYLGKEITITYNATVTADAVTGANAFENKIELEYTNTPGETKKTEPKITHMYTYDFTNELKKVDEKDAPLAGAIFTLYTDAECKTPFHYKNSDAAVTSTSTAGEGAEAAYIDFYNLPAGTYYVKETQAPTGGYQLTGKIFKIEIVPDKNEKNEPTEDATITITDLSTGRPATEVINTKLSALPSTGGMGTYLFTIGGVVIMAGAAGLLIAKRRRDA